ncbi:exosome complex exonuclease RRP40 [Phakopsora pachyrhizi]|nr:exosome complex exonuclease RRP40 [Phakopsora pachyrhizi]
METVATGGGGTSRRRSIESGQLVLPGDRVGRIESNPNNGQESRNGRSKRVVKVGPGLSVDDQTSVVRSNRLGICGKLRSENLEQFWIEGRSKRYVPALGDPVIGIVLGRQTEGYRIDINSNQPAYLDGLAFEGATKRSKPNLKTGAIVYGRISSVLGFMEAEIECFDGNSQSADGFGEMLGGMLVRDLLLERCRSLIKPPHEILNDIGKRLKFEISIGMNGRIWCKAETIRETVELIKFIKQEQK